MEKTLVLDTETTGIVPGKDRLVSVAYYFDDPSTSSGQALKHELFKPPVEISIDSQATHHITPEMVANKPAFIGSDTYEELEKLLPDYTLVAHNAAFDISFLEAEDLKIPKHICTVKLARHLDSAGVIPRFGLQYLRYYLKLNVKDAEAHSADGDVLVTVALFQRLAEKMRPDFKTDEEMLAAMREISLKPMLIRRFSFGKFKGEKIQDIASREPGYLQWLLEQKQKDGGLTEARGDDEDMIFSLKHFLKLRA